MPAQPIEHLFTTTISQAEILSGVAIMRDGQRRRDLEAVARSMFLEDFEDRLLPFDTEAAVAYADLFAARRRARRPASTLDLMIAAIERSGDASVVTREIGGFAGCDVNNPRSLPPLANRDIKEK